MSLLETHLHTHSLQQGYFVEGDREHISRLFPQSIFEVVSFNRAIGIDDIRTLLRKITLASSAGKRQVVLIDAKDLERLAKSALLKIVEEPPPYTHFIFYGISKKMLPPTLSSRLLDGGTIHSASSSSLYAKTAEAFMKAGQDKKKRENILKDIPDNVSLALFLDDFEQLLRAKNKLQGHKTLEHMHKAREMLAHPIPLPSLIKDYISLLL